MIKNFLCFLFLTGLFFTVSALAQPELDTTFRSTGKAFLQFTASGMTQDTVVQPDNKIILIGNCNSINVLGPIPFCLIRLNVDGSFDTTFGAGQGNLGYVFTKIPGFNATPNTTTGVALQNDGKIVVTGSVASISKQIAILRYNVDGSLDSSFGTAGIVTAVVNGEDLANKVLIQPDGKIVVVGYSGSSSNYRQFITRYLSTGTLDTSFGTGGVATINTPGNLTSGLAIAIQPDGKIVTGGAMSTLSGDPNPTTYFLVTRLNPNGSLDTSFDGDGVKSIVSGINLFPEAGIVSVAVQSDNRIVALGGYTNVLYRFNSDGSLDTSFDNDGSRSALNGTSDSFDLIITPSGKITVVGSPAISTDFPNIYFRTARYLSDGSPDTSFSNDGFLDIDIPEFMDGATAVALDQQGRIVIGGRSGGGIRNAPWINPLFSVARLLAQPAQNVGFSGRVTDSGGKPIANAYLALSGNSGIIGYSRTNPFGYFRFTNVPTNQTYTLSTYSKNLNYYERRVLVDGEVTSFLVVGSK